MNTYPSWLRRIPEMIEVLALIDASHRRRGASASTRRLGTYSSTYSPDIMAAGAAAAGISKAIKAAGVVVWVEPEEFFKLMNRVKDPLIVVAEGWFLERNIGI